MMVHITKAALATFAGILLLLANNVAAVDFIVGDMHGWTSKGFDYQEWAKDKVFKAGDRLVFQYPQGVHNVYKVDFEGFVTCQEPLSHQPLTSGNDIVELKVAGKMWFICGVADHCSSHNQKLEIEVVPDFTYWFPPSPPTSAPPSPLPWFPWPTPTPTPMPTPTPSSPSVNVEQIPCFPFPVMPMPMPPMPPSSPPFWIPYIPVGNAPSPSPYFSTGDKLSSDENTNNYAEAPWMTPCPWTVPPTIAPTPTVDISTWWPFPETPSPSPSYAMNE